MPQAWDLGVLCGVAGIQFGQMSESFLSSLDSLSETIFGNARCMVMHSDAIVFLF